MELFRRFTEIDGCCDTCAWKMTNPMFDWIETVGARCEWTTAFVFETFQLENLRESSKNRLTKVSLIYGGFFR